MAILKIVKFGDPLLRKTSRPVEEITPRIITLLDDMIDTMRAAGGCGLAAVQVGVLRRVFVMGLGDGVIGAVNPEILSTHGKQTGQEGCLSFPNQWDDVTRPKRVKFKAQDRNGKWFIMTGEDLMARCICHETDHLDGIVFLDRVGESK